MQAYPVLPAYRTNYDTDLCRLPAHLPMMRLPHPAGHKDLQEATVGDGAAAFCRASRHRGHVNSLARC